jgi:hypothetical protein
VGEDFQSPAAKEPDFAITGIAQVTNADVENLVGADVLTGQ